MWCIGDSGNEITAFHGGLSPVIWNGTGEIFVLLLKRMRKLYLRDASTVHSVNMLEGSEVHVEYLLLVVIKIKTPCVLKMNKN